MNVSAEANAYVHEPFISIEMSTLFTKLEFGQIITALVNVIYHYALVIPSDKSA